MVDFVISVLFYQVVQLSILTLWFDSKLFSHLLGWCISQRDYYSTHESKSYRKLPALLLLAFFMAITCYQCFGYWVAFAVVSVVPYFSNGILPQYSIILTISIGLAIAYISHMLNQYYPYVE